MTLIIFLKIILNGFSSAICLPVSDGYMLKTANYLLSFNQKISILPFVILATFLALIANFYIGIFLRFIVTTFSNSKTIDQIKNDMERQKYKLFIVTLTSVIFGYHGIAYMSTVSGLLSFNKKLTILAFILIAITKCLHILMF